VASPRDAEVARLSALITRQRRELDLLSAQAQVRSILDLARGMLMEQLGCSAAEAQRQLARLAEEAQTNVTELAAQIARQLPPDAVPEPGPGRLGAAWATMEAAPDGNAIAAAMLAEVLTEAGAAAVALWLIEPDGGLALAGQAGFGAREASRWRRIHPDMTSLPQQVAHVNAEIWWPAGPPQGDRQPLMGRWPGGARAALPLQEAGVTLGVMMICWPEPADGFAEPLRRQIAALAGLGAQTLGTRLPHGELAGGSQAWWVFGLLDDLHGSVLFARAVRDDDGKVTDFRIDHASPGFRDPAGRGAAGLTGRTLLEMFPAAAAAGGLFDCCAAALDGAGPQHIEDRADGGGAGAADAAVHQIRVARLYDGGGDRLAGPGLR